MQKCLFAFLLSIHFCFAQKSDFEHISFEKADNIAQRTKAKNLLQLNKLTLELTQNLDSDVEKVRAIYKWICTNVASDFKLYYKNERKRKKYENDSIKLEAWNSELKKILFKKLLRKKRTICTGYAYLFKEMCDLAGIKSTMIYGFGRTRDVNLFDPKYPNHTWSAVYINQKWYLCDPTWSAGIAYADGNSFKFEYNHGYFLAEPELFIYNHYPLNTNESLLANTPSLQEFSALPLLYGTAYLYFNKHSLPQKMHHEIKKNESINFEYELSKPIDTSKIYLMITTSTNKKVNPNIDYQKNALKLSYTFTKSDFYDVHLYIDDLILATYTVNVN